MGEVQHTRYTKTAVILHWLIAIGVFVLIGLAWYMMGLPKKTPERSYFYNLHKSIGLTVAALVVIRVWWRAKHTPPPLPGTMPQWQVTASHWSHLLLYTSLIFMPIFGFVASNFSKWGVKYFGIQVGPLFPESKAMYDMFQSFHRGTAYVLITLIVIHVLAALKHAFIDRDAIHKRLSLRG